MIGKKNPRYKSRAFYLVKCISLIQFGCRRLLILYPQINLIRLIYLSMYHSCLTPYKVIIIIAESVNAIGFKIYQFTNCNLCCLHSSFISLWNCKNVLIIIFIIFNIPQLLVILYHENPASNWVSWLSFLLSHKRTHYKLT